MGGKIEKGKRLWEVERRDVSSSSNESPICPAIFNEIPPRIDTSIDGLGTRSEKERTNASGSFLHCEIVKLCSHASWDEVRYILHTDADASGKLQLSPHVSYFLPTSSYLYRYWWKLLQMDCT